MTNTKVVSTKRGVHSRWYRLDNAAKLYPAIKSPRLTTFFRLSVTLHETVDPELLQKALIRVIDRFPYYRVRLCQGFFWYYIEHNPEEPHVESDERYPCMQLDTEKNRHYLFRVRYFQRRVAVEFIHALTDGTGAMTFLKTLVAEYLRLQGLEIPAEEGVLPLDYQHPEEEEDAYNRFYKPAIPNPEKDSAAYHIPGQLEPTGVYNVITGVIPLSQILAEAKRRSLTLTEFLVALYIDSIQQVQDAHVKPEKMRPIRMSVPVNLRKIFPSRTMRNFSLYVTPDIDPRLGHYTFDEVARAVMHHMRAEVNEKSISRQISRNVGGEKNPIVKAMPLMIKKGFLSFMHSRLGENLFSGSLSNLGPVTFPQAMTDQIERVEFIPGPNPVNKTTCSVISYGDSLYISFARLIKEAEVERIFFTSVRKMGIHVRVESNQ